MSNAMTTGFSVKEKIMRPSAALYSGLTWASLMASIMAQEASTPPSITQDASKQENEAKPADAAKATVDRYFENWKQGKGIANLELFQSPQVVVSGMLHSPKAAHWSKSAAEYMKRFPDKPIEFLPVDSLEVDLLHEGLAIAKVKYRGGGHKDSAIFTIQKTTDADWKIVSLYVDSHFVW
jgi:hypothetical protein